jgi:hypothetical protein
LCSDEKLTRLKLLQRSSEIRHRVDPFVVRPYLFEKGILSRQEYEDCFERRICCKTLIDVLERKRDEQFPFFHLKVALAASGRYGHILGEDDGVNKINYG